MRRTRRWGACVVAGAAACIVAAVPLRADARTTVSLGTAGVMSLYYPVGGAVCRMINVTRKINRLRCSVEVSEGSVANIREVIAGKLDLGIAQGDVQHYAREGEGPFADDPQPKLRALFSVYPETLTFVARDDAGVRTVADLKGKRVSVGTAGSGTRATVALALTASGVPLEALGSTPDTSIVELAPSLCDGKMDAFGYVDGHPNPVIQDATGGCRSHVLAVTGPGVEALLAARPYYVRTVVPSRPYKGMKSDQATIGAMAAVVVSEDMDDATAYAITKAVFDNFDDFRKLHPVLAGLTREQAARGTGVPLHPGAARYFRDAGLMP